MAQINVIGYVAEDIVLKQSHKGNAYVCFFVKEYTGKGRSQGYQVWVWENILPKLQRLKIRKGSLVWVTGSVELVDSTTRNGQEKTKIMRRLLPMTVWRIFLPEITGHSWFRCFSGMDWLPRSNLRACS